MSKTLLYLLDIKIDGTCLARCNRDPLIKVIEKVNDVLLESVKRSENQKDGEPKCRIIHKFKVTGEPRVVTVVETSEGEVELEKIISELSAIGVIDITCTPLTDYEMFAQTVLDVDPDLCKPAPRTLGKKYTHWNDLTLDYQGMTWENFKILWAKEASTVLGLRIKTDVNVDLYKIKNCRKVMVLSSVDDADETDAMFSKLPLFVENGHNVGNVCRALQSLDEYIRKMSQ
ncbi:uncharacterized protein LOC110466061 [Mizuhopecten yessoensis]|uniref:Uncharacterized protein n=1 Tax=Mizuhopecten yessoensis TaxID=6573 RepID=A0A210PQ67_MIZYE|nr:uncharacterized protein LOC110466061 [Mizuhopecten yessoensis]XP_021377999.1 uncharacterized protein LOC110466061 [Mizuhopecten yessoensis]OWF38617.1 hypothetical protein KP79_PYT09939 [Mizuhopecten yessoensis]